MTERVIGTALVSTPHRRSSLFGPLVWWELARLARRRTCRPFAGPYSLRPAAHRSRFRSRLVPLSPEKPHTSSCLGPPAPCRSHRAAELSETLALVLLEAQLLFVAAVTPAYAASAISEEKDRETLPLLLTTDLTDREIIWGKAVGRVLFVLLAVLAGVPVIMITLFFGGVDPSLLASGYALTAGTAILSAAIGVSAACHAADTRTALVRAYGQSAILIGGVLIPPFVFLSPFAMLIYTRLDFAEHSERDSVRVRIRLSRRAGHRGRGARRDRDARSENARCHGRAGRPDGISRAPRGRPAPIVLAPPEPEARATAGPGRFRSRSLEGTLFGRAKPLPVFDAPVRWLGGGLRPRGDHAVRHGRLASRQASTPRSQSRGSRAPGCDREANRPIPAEVS